MLIVANWKAYVEDLAKAKKLVALSKRLSLITDHEIVLAPPAALLSTFSLANRSKVAFAAQDVSSTTGGAHTGEVTAAAFAAARATFAIVGHSESRARGDTDAVVAEKLARVLAQGLTPILCIGEKERDGEGRYLQHIREQLVNALTPLQPKERTQIIVAYEPLWAIGKSADAAIAPQDLAEMTLYIRKVLAEYLPGMSANRSRVLYGGAVEPGVSHLLAAHSSIDGFLIGHASADPAQFRALVTELIPHA